MPTAPAGSRGPDAAQGAAIHTNPVTIILIIGIFAVFLGLKILAAVVVDRSRVYCNEPECRRFLADDEKLLAHDQEHHGEKWPDGRPFLDFTKAYDVDGRARWKWSIRQFMVGGGVLLAVAYIVIRVF